MITIHAFKWLPPFAQGVARDMRLRWALEEAGIPYQAKLVSFEDKDSPGYRALQPFGQVPVLEDGNLTMFESGAIVLYLGERSEKLLPADPAARAHAITWLLCALNTIEVAVLPLVAIDLFHTDKAWAKERRPEAEATVRKRLAELAARLGDRDYLEGEFTAGDLMMTTVLRFLRHTDLVAEQPNLQAHLARCEARPAFQKALADHMAPFAEQAAVA